MQQPAGVLDVTGTSADLQSDSVLLHRKGDRCSNAGVVREGVAADWERWFSHAVHLQEILEFGVALHTNGLSHICRHAALTAG